MLKIFRKIRQDLLIKKQLNKYFTYAFGEVFLVMIGILLALYISNWNDAKKEREKEEWYLINIVEDIEYQKVYLKFMIEHYNESITIEKSIIKEYIEKKSFSTIDSLNNKLSYLMQSYRLPNTNNTYQELVSSGQLGLIKDKFLSIDIINYFLGSDINYNDLKKDLDNIFYKEVYPVFNAYSQIIIENDSIFGNEDFILQTDEELNRYLKKKLQKPVSRLQLINAIKIKLQLQQNYLEIVKIALEDSDSLIKKIDNYLGLTPDMVNTY